MLLGFFENYRLHSKKDEDEKNLVSKSTVVRGVLFQQFIQAIVAIILFKVSSYFLFHFFATIAINNHHRRRRRRTCRYYCNLVYF